MTRRGDTQSKCLVGPNWARFSVETDRGPLGNGLLAWEWASILGPHNNLVFILIQIKLYFLLIFSFLKKFIK